MMAAFVSHGRRHLVKARVGGVCNIKPFVAERLLCSSSQNENSIPVIKPVAYSPKDNEAAAAAASVPDRSLSRSPAQAQGQGGRRPRDNRPPPVTGEETPVDIAANSPSPPSLTREDIRYVKDQPSSISPVSYPSRAPVAPLPEDMLPGEDDKKEANANVPRRNTQQQQQKVVVPFPTLIKRTKNKPKPLLDLQEAIREVKANAKVKFDETVEAHVNLGVDPKRGDQMVRGATTLPHGTGKVIKIAVFAEGAAAEEARAAGADIVGGDELIEEIRKGGGKLSFDKCISTPLYMPRLGKIARILGPRGLMPNPKLGSVTSDVAAAVRDAKRGRIDFKIDKTAIVHVGLGKVSFTEESLRENVGAFVNALLLAKPVGLKKTSKYAGYVNSFSLSSTMGPGFPVSVQSLSMAADHYNKLQLK